MEFGGDNPQNGQSPNVPGFRPLAGQQPQQPNIQLVSAYYGNEGPHAVDPGNPDSEPDKGQLPGNLDYNNNSDVGELDSRKRRKRNRWGPIPNLQTENQNLMGLFGDQNAFNNQQGQQPGQQQVQQFDYSTINNSNTNLQIQMENIQVQGQGQEQYVQGCPQFQDQFQGVQVQGYEQAQGQQMVQGQVEGQELAQVQGQGEGQPQVGEEQEKKKKKRRSRWETEDNENSYQDKSIITKFPSDIVLKGGYKVKLPPALTGQPVSTDPKVQSLYDNLAELNKRILNNDLQIPPTPERSPSPEPQYDINGVRLNTREVRIKEKLLFDRNMLIEDLITEDPNFRPPTDFRPMKKWRKIFIPQRDFPGYNFIGLIIGPRGNTQKRMQKETNTKIAIRGKGSIKDGSQRDPKYDHGEDEELHVLVTGDTQEDVDKAAFMIAKLLQPVDEDLNEHKRLQLRELAALNGTMKDEMICYLCGETTHRSYECPTPKTGVFQLPEDLKQKVEDQYARDLARVNAGNVDSAMGVESEFKRFLDSLGGDVPSSEYAVSPSMSAAIDSLMSYAYIKPKRPGDELPDDHKLYIGNLSQSIDDDALRNILSPFGEVLHASVLMDVISGTSRGYGFVHLSKAESARKAVYTLNGKMVDGRQLVVRLRSDGPPTNKPSYGPQTNEDCKLYISSLPQSTSEGQLLSLFQRHGAVNEVKLIRDRNSGTIKGYAFIQMGSKEAAQAAATDLHGTLLDGKNISVRIAQSKEEQQKHFMQSQQYQHQHQQSDYQQQEMEGSNSSFRPPNLSPPNLQPLPTPPPDLPPPPGVGPPRGPAPSGGGNAPPEVPPFPRPPNPRYYQFPDQLQQPRLQQQQPQQQFSSQGPPPRGMDVPPPPRGMDVPPPPRGMDAPPPPGHVPGGPNFFVPQGQFRPQLSFQGGVGRPPFPPPLDQSNMYFLPGQQHMPQQQQQHHQFHQQKQEDITQFQQKQQQPQQQQFQALQKQQPQQSSEYTLDAEDVQTEYERFMKEMQQNAFLN